MKILRSPNDGGPDLSGFEDPDAGAVEIITLKPGEEPPKEEVAPDDDGKITMTKEEFAALKNNSDSTSILSQGLKELASTLKPSQAQAVNALQQQPGETDEAFEKRLEEDLFAKDKTGKVLNEAIDRRTGKLISGLASLIADQNRELLQLKPETAPIFKKYGKEIEEYVAALPASKRNMPHVWTQAVNEIKSRHQEEIMSEEMSSKITEEVNRKVAEALRAHGIEPDEEGETAATAPKTPRASTISGSGGGRTAHVGSGPAPKRIYATPEDVEAAKQLCVPLEEYIARKPKK